ncbi:pathogenicity island protein [Mammaliicoccus sciuri]|uniref:pathogenicity island protein n=1 Tax=Mammaliicoccus sciuri TaxID=1296 RepID=UPI002DBDA9FD|nr:pathogenicity island protein [Mammaliicoccus sciuri]MEB6122789.1 pathogenicity island protein [Mammaliicoccus sciuri]MEB6313018.1 pathogenicity island protein [Mammaliicoccus sciuri]MEB6696524.1 pathogenicity island protein [Mammaliicoccus sciuri]
MLPDFENNKFTEYELLMKFNPKIINSKIKAMNMQIECMYHLNMSHVITADNGQLVSTSYPLDKLVIYIIEEKSKLSYYKRKSDERLKILKRVISSYTLQEKRNIMRYMATNGRVKDFDVIDRLQVDLYKACRKTSDIEQIKSINDVATFKVEEKRCTV